MPLSRPLCCLCRWCDLCLELVSCKERWVFNLLLSLCVLLAYSVSLYRLCRYLELVSCTERYSICHCHGILLAYSVPLSRPLCCLCRWCDLCLELVSCKERWIFNLLLSLCILLVYSVSLYRLCRCLKLVSCTERWVFNLSLSRYSFGI